MRYLVPLLTMAAAMPAETKPIAEIMHYWTSPGEHKALEVFAEAYRRRGGEWFSVATASSNDLRREGASRIADGYPPTAMQWHAGPDLHELVDLELINDLGQMVDVDTLRRELLPQVLRAITIDDKLVVIPTNIHGDNWAWYHLPAYRKVGLETPRSWRQVLEQAPAIQQAGYVPIAIGDSRWEHRLLFNSILLDVGGADTYMDLVQNRELPPAAVASLVEAIQLYLDLRRYVDAGWKQRTTWLDSTKMVMQGDAAMQIMGDWAKSEFLNAGQVPGQDFGCDAAPGNEDAYLVVIDVFALSRTDDPTQRWSQAVLAETMLDPKVQHDFALAKGALPVRKDVELVGFDDCAKRGWAILSDPSAQLPAPMLIMTERLSETLSGTLRDAWDDPASQSAVVANALLSAFAAMREPTG